MHYRPKHINSTGGVAGAVVALLFGFVQWIFPEIPAPPPGLEGAAVIVIAWAISQFGKIGGTKNESDAAT